MGIDPISLMAIGQMVGVASSVIGVGAGLANANMQAQVAENNAKVMDENARKLAAQAQQHQLDLAEQQQTEKGQALAEAGASGIDLTSGSSALQRAALDRLARRDQQRTATDDQNSVSQVQQGALDYRTTAFNTRQQGLTSAIGGIAGGFDSYITSATAISKAKLDLLK